MEKGKKVGIAKKDALGVIANLLGIEAEKNEVVVYHYNRPTDDCLCPEHVAVSLDPEGKTFFGIPQKAVTWN